MRLANQSAAPNRLPAGQSDGSDNLSAIVAADRAFPAAVAELGRYAYADVQHHPPSRMAVSHGEFVLVDQTVARYRCRYFGFRRVGHSCIRVFHVACPGSSK